MKRRIRAVLASSKTTYLAAIAATILSIIAGLVLGYYAHVWLVLSLGALSAFSACLSWLSFVFRTHMLIRAQRGPAEMKVLSSQFEQITRELSGKFSKHLEQQDKEYRNQALNTLIKLEQLRLSLSSNPKGNYDK